MANVDNDNYYINRFTVEDVKEAMTKVKCGKTCGLNGIYEEHKSVNGKLHVLLSLLLNAIIIHGHVPKHVKVLWIHSILVLLVKDKEGDLNEKNNYQPLAQLRVLFQSSLRYLF